MAGDPGMSQERRLDDWLREEADVAAPDRLLQDVFARTEGARQVRGGWRGRPASIARRRALTLASWRRHATAVAALVLVGLVGVSIGARLGTAPAGSTPSASPAAASPPIPVRDLVPLRSHQTCARRGGLVVLPATASDQASAWVTCGADAEEVVIGSDAVTRRSGLGAIATDGTSDWAIRGDSVVELAADRSVERSVRIGTPGSLVVAGSRIWVLDALTGQVEAIGPKGIDWSVSPAPSGRLIAIASVGGGLWVLDQGAAAVLRLDPADGRLIGTIPVAASPTSLVAAARALYVGSPLSGTIARIDPATGDATTLRPDLGPDGHLDALGGSPDALIVGSRTTLARLDPIDGRVLGFTIGSEYVAAVGIDGPTMIVLTEAGTLVEAERP